MSRSSGNIKSNPTIQEQAIVSFLCPSQLDAVRFPQLFQRFFETVHAGNLIVKLLSRRQLPMLQPTRKT